MGRFKKGIAFCLLAAMVATTAPMSADAGSGCTHTSTKVNCENVREISAGNHQIGEPSGNVITCYITVVYGEHTVKCDT